MPRRKGKNLKQTPKKKLKWEGFKITRVKLNPEQAVLSCCDQARRLPLIESWACLSFVPCYGSTQDGPSS